MLDLLDQLSDLDQILKSREFKTDFPMIYSQEYMSGQDAESSSTLLPATESSADIISEESIRSALNMMDTLETANAPVFNLSAFIDAQIQKGIDDYKKDSGETPDSRVTVIANPSVYNANAIDPRKGAPVSYIRRYSIRDVVTGKYLYDIAKQSDSLGRKYEWPRIEWGQYDKGLLDYLTDINLENKIKEALTAYRHNTTKTDALKSLYQQQVTAACIAYLEAPENKEMDTVFTRAVNDFLEGKVQAMVINFEGAHVNEAFLIPAGEYGVLLSLNQPGHMIVKHGHGYKEKYDKSSKWHLGNAFFPNSEDFKTWLLNKLPVKHAVQEKETKPINLQWNSGGYYVSGGAMVNVHYYYKPRISFSATASRADLAEQLFNGFMSNLDSDTDYLIHTKDEQRSEHWLKVAKAALEMLGALLNMVAPGTGTLVGRIGLLIANLAIDASLVAITIVQSQNADYPEDVQNLINEAILTGITGGISAGVDVRVLSRELIKKSRMLYRMYRTLYPAGSLQTEIRNISSLILGEANWQRLSEKFRMDILTRDVPKRAAAQSLISRSSSNAVQQMIASMSEMAAKDTKQLLTTTIKKFDDRMNDYTKEFSGIRGRINTVMTEPQKLKYEKRLSDNKSIAEWAVAADNGDSVLVQAALYNVSQSDAPDILSRSFITKLYESLPGENALYWKNHSPWSYSFHGYETSLYEAHFFTELNRIKAMDLQGRLTPHARSLALYTLMRKSFLGRYSRTTARTLYAISELREGRSTFKPLSSADESYLTGESVSAERGISGTETYRKNIVPLPDINPQKMVSWPEALKQRINFSRLEWNDDRQILLTMVEADKLLTEKGMKNVAIRKVQVWNGSDTGIHYALTGEVDDNEYIVELYGLNALGYQEPFTTLSIQPESVWAYRYQNLGNENKWLVKYKDYRTTAGTTEILESADRRHIIDGEKLLTKPVWYENELTSLKAESVLQFGDFNLPVNEKVFNKMFKTRMAYIQNVSDGIKVSDENSFINEWHQPVDHTSIPSDVRVNMSEQNLMKRFITGSSWTLKERVAVSKLIEQSRMRTLTDASVRIAPKYSKLLEKNSVKRIIAPQTFLMSGMGASEIPVALFTASALSLNHQDRLFRNFYRAGAHTDTPNLKFFQVFEALSDTDLTPYLKTVSFKGKAEGTIEQITSYLENAPLLSQFTLESQDVTMLVGRAGPGGSFTFFDPRVGLFIYKNTNDLTQALKNTIGTKAMGHLYQAFGSQSDPLYQLSQVNVDSLSTLPLMKDRLTGKPVTLQSLLEEDFNDPACIIPENSGRSKRALKCRQLDTDISALEGIRERVMENVDPGAVDFSFDYLTKLDLQNSELALGLEDDIQLLQSAYAAVASFRNEIRQSGTGMSTSARTGYLNYLSSLIDVAQKVRSRTSLITSKGWGSAALPWGISHPRHKPIPGSVGRHTYGKTSAGSRPRNDRTDNGVWPGERGTMPGEDKEYFELAEQFPKGAQIDDINVELLDNMRRKEAALNKKQFNRNGVTKWGRIKNNSFEISKDNRATWKKGKIIDEFHFRMQTTKLLPFGINYFSELRRSDPLTRVAAVARKVAEDNTVAFSQASRMPRDPLAIYGGGESWDSVFKLEKKSGLMTQVQYNEVKEKMKSDRSIYVGDPAVPVMTMEQLKAIPAGYRIAIMDSANQVLVHAMISGGNGIAFGLKNSVIGGENFWSEIDLSEIFDLADGEFILKKGLKPHFRIAADHYSAPAQRSVLRAPARPVDKGMTATGNTGIVRNLVDGKVEKLFSKTATEKNSPMLKSAENNAEGFNRYYGKGSAEVKEDIVTGSNPPVYQVRNILKKIPGVSLDKIKNAGTFSQLKSDIMYSNPINSLKNRLVDAGIEHNDINAGNIMYDKHTGDFNLIDFDTATFTPESGNGYVPLTGAQADVIERKLESVLGNESIAELMKRKGIDTVQNTSELLIEPTIRSRPDRALSMEENTLIQETTTSLQTSLGKEYMTFTMNPSENFANAAAEVSKTLRLNGFTDVKLVELGIWPNGGTETLPANHYVVMAKKGGTDIVVDLTAGQFERYGFNGPIISTQDNWIYQWQQNLRDKPRTLVKMVLHRGGFGSSAFTSAYINPQDVVPGGSLLQRPKWYKNTL
ncbi:hypothetical protein [Enterobacter roggenkampii]|uniref:hypothetical protein n=1 Tax=Enterobacter roggenkampii TaxID=1812935 RepID=UPI002DBD62B1|nr:hypothetical protein [Enterobacter roggenkampii]MEB5889985.1 hypothetical protein [Enterobacter roggenkampii]